jgi:hypothetical protein
MSLRSLKVFLVTAAAVGGLGLAGAAFADDDGPPPDYSAPPVLSPVQLDLEAIQVPLQDLVGLSNPGAVVTTELVPEDQPTQVIVSVSDPSGEKAKDATLDAAYVRSLVMAAPHGEQREALMDAVRIGFDDRMTQHDLNPTPITVATSTDTSAS